MLKRFVTVLDWIAVIWLGLVLVATLEQLFFIDFYPKPWSTFITLSIPFIPLVIVRWILVGSPKLFDHPVKDQS